MHVYNYSMYAIHYGKIPSLAYDMRVFAFYHHCFTKLSVTETCLLLLSFKQTYKLIKRSLAIRTILETSGDQVEVFKIMHGYEGLLKICFYE